MKLYECPVHGGGDILEHFPHIDCLHCIKIRDRILEQAKAHEAAATMPRVRLLDEVYWPTNNSHEGRLIHNLEHKPKFFATKREYRNYLREKGVREAG